MSIMFNDVPAGAQNNLNAVEVTKDKPSVGLIKVTQRIALVGHADPGISTYVDAEPVQVFSAGEVSQKFGAGWQIADMAEKLFRNSGAVEVFAFPLQEDGGDTAATGTMTVTVGGTAEAGTFAVYIAGRRVEVSTLAAATVTDIADAIVAAVTAATKAVVTVSNAAGVVTFVCRWKGETGDDIVLAVNTQTGETLPGGGVAIAIVAMGAVVAGAGNPDLQDALDNFEESKEYTIIAHPFLDTTNVTALEAFEATRWDAKVARGFFGICGVRGSYTVAVTNWTETRNSFISSFIWQQSIPELQASYGAGVAGMMARRGANDPSQQFNGQAILGVTVPPASTQERWTVRDAGVKRGAAATKFTDTAVVIDQMVSTYQTTAEATDAPLVDRFLNTVMTLTAVIFDWQQYLNTQWAGAKLADDGQEFKPGQKVMTRNTMKAELLSRYENYLDEGWVENIADYANTIITARPSGIRIDAQDQLILIGGMRISARLISYNYAQ